MRFGLLAVALLAAVSGAAVAQQKSKKGDDAKVRALVDRQLEIGHRLASGKLALDAGDHAGAAAQLEKLLAVPGLPDDVRAAAKSLLAQAKGTKGPSTDDGLVPPSGLEQASDDGEQVKSTDRLDKGVPRTDQAPRPRPPAQLTVTGSVAGGGSSGPGGAVVSLRRVDGATPKPTPITNKPLVQKNKAFQPHVLAVPVGSSVVFRNDDEIFHNVFSISPIAKFDTGLKKSGDSERVVFEKPGVIELFCNIHASMQGWLVVVDTPFFAVADGSGSFSIPKVPPGEYDVEVWHENASSPSKKRVNLSEATARLSLEVSGDKRQNPYPPDKYGKPRQQQLGY